MTDLTCIGLGLMGTALARAMLAAGHRVTVWNRSPGKADALMEMGAEVAQSLAEAVAASPVVVICIDSYATTREILGAGEVRPRLAGRTLVQLSTGTPREALEFSEWVSAQGGRYLDGAILCGPPVIGTERGRILVSGDTAAWTGAEPWLRCLAGNLRFVGQGAGDAAALDLAWLTTCYTEFLGVAHAASICRAQGVSLQAFIDIFPEGSAIRMLAKTVMEEDYAHPTSTLEVWAEALARIQTQARAAGIPPAIRDFVAGYFRRAIEMGLGREKAIAIYKALGAEGNGDQVLGGTKDQQP